MLDDIPLSSKIKKQSALLIIPILSLIYPTIKHPIDFRGRIEKEPVQVTKTYSRTLAVAQSDILLTTEHTPEPEPEKKAPVVQKKVKPRVATQAAADVQEGSARQVSVSAYCSVPSQTSGDPFITASGQHVSEEIISTNSLPFGTKVSFPDIPSLAGKVFVVGDRMSKRYWNHADIWMPTCEQAVQFGRRTSTMVVLSQ